MKINRESSPLVTIEEVRSLIERKHSIKFAIDKPKISTTSDIYAFMISGWVVSIGARVLNIEIVLNSRVIRKARVDIPRLDVMKVFPTFKDEANHSSGFCAELGVLGLPLTFSLQVRAVLDTEQRIPLCDIQGSRRPIALQYSSSLYPLLLVSMGRTGTTWIMRLLSQHPSIVAHCRYPYETRLAQYWVHMLKTLSEPADHSESAIPSRFFTDSSWVGKNPFYKTNSDLKGYLGRDYIEDLVSFCKENIDNLYLYIADSQNKRNPVYFIEKAVTSNFHKLFSEIYPKSREVFLVRDLRDMFCSILAFNAKRGYQDFGQQYSQTEEEFIWNLKNRAASLQRAWKESNGKSYLIRYEDAIADPAETLIKLFTYLGLDNSKETINNVIKRASIDTPELEQHRTSKTAKNSIGRWQQDLTPQLQEICNEAFEGFLKEFGYLT